IARRRLPGPLRRGPVAAAAGSPLTVAGAAPALHRTSLSRRWLTLSRVGFRRHPPPRAHRGRGKRANSTAEAWTRHTVGLRYEPLPFQRERYLFRQIKVVYESHFSKALPPTRLRLADRPGGPPLTG